MSSAVGGGFNSPWLVDVVGAIDIWVLVGVATGVYRVVEATAVEFWVGAGVSEVEAMLGGEGFGVRTGGGGGLFIICHFTRSRVAMESSTDE